MEKKLTDEEIVKALENQANGYGAGIVGDLSALTLDLIHRLQDEKKELKSIAEYQQGSNMERWQIIQEKDKMIAKQKAEIERLTDVNGYLDGCDKQFLADYQNAQVQVDELKEERYYTEQDTAKEIFTDLLKEFSIRKSCGNADVVVREMAQRKGVEVE